VKPAGGIALLASLAWVISGFILALLRRGIQITWMMPMTNKEEHRMNQTIRLIAPLVLIGSALWLSATTHLIVGLLALTAGCAMFAKTLNERSKVADPPSGEHR
jgi:hypothetical protein